MTKFEAIKEQYQKAVARFDEVLQKEKNPTNRDSAIKRFEFSFDLSWKVIKAYLEEEKGVSCQSPKECFREAYRQGVLDYDELWLKMADWRNQAVHTYSEKFADILYRELPEVQTRFRALKEKMEKLG